MSNKLIELKNLTKNFDDQQVLRGINLDIHENEFLTLLGPSGCGKTTTLRIIAGFEEPSGGEVLFNGIEISKLPPYKREINTVFQKYALFPHLNVMDNIGFGLNLKKVDKSVIEQKVKRMLKMVGLEGFEKRDVTLLSGGQQQRVAIARALVNEPKVLLLDEPLGALDAKIRKQMQIELKKIQREVGITFIYVTHDQEEALSMSDTVVVMNNGEIQQIGSPTDIYNEPENRFVAGFIGAPSMNFMETMVTEKNGAVYLEADAGFSLRAEGENEMVLRRNYLGKMVILGLRPEDLQEKATAEVHGICSRENRVKAFVELREMIGAEAYLHMHAGRNQLTARVPSEAPVAVKEYITLYADMEKAQIFDPFTEENILCPPAAKEERATA